MKQLHIFHEESQNKNQSIRWTLYVDGASRKNPGSAGAGIYLLKGQEPVFKRGFFLGQKTNNQAEYLALLLGLFYWKKHANSADTLKIVSDSELLIKQMNHEYRVRDEQLLKFFTAAMHMLQGIHFRLVHVLRDENQEADAMANIGIDRQRHVPQEFLSAMQQYGITV